MDKIRERGKCMKTAQFTGWMDQVFTYIEEDQLLRRDLWKRFVNQFAQEDADFEGGWRGEYWGK